MKRAMRQEERCTLRREIELLHPAEYDFPSGGNVYNRSLAEAAKSRNVPLSLRALRASELDALLHEESAHLRIWDSLFLDVLAGRDFECTQGWGLLLHYLPSENPALARAERIRLAGIEARAVERAGLVIVTGRALEAALRRHGLRRPVFVCEPGVSAPFLEPRKQVMRARNTLELVTVANLLPGKGMIELLAVLADVRDIGWRWHVIGDRALDAVYTRRFDAALEHLGLDGRVVQHGGLQHTAIAHMMDDMDLFVFFSRFEAYGMALAEAAARCLPAVTTEVGAAACLYRHGATGLLAAPDDTQRFAGHLERLMRDSAMRARFSDNLRLGEPRTWEDTLDDFLIAVTGLE